MNNNEASPSIPDIGDYLKLGACTAVMLQPILSYALKLGLSDQTQILIGVLYNLVKYTAPAFIFGILYTTTRTTINQRKLTYGKYMKMRWHDLFIPTIWWTLFYLLIMPQVQQVNKYHDLLSFLWYFVNGNAAPHLWYNTMMLQFIILMPLFWFIGHLCEKSKKAGLVIIAVTLIITALWLWFYDTRIFNGPDAQKLYLCDRLFISFLIYGVFGVLAWQYRKEYNALIQKGWLILVLIFLGTFYWTNQELFSFGLPVNLGNAPYYKPSMVIYDLAVIGLFSALCLYQVRHGSKFTNFVHKFAGFAYKAYLSNVLWSQLLWMTFTKKITMNMPWIGIIITYVLTWILAFASAFGLHYLWSNLKKFIK
ncbi:acyltransferase [Lactobacillus sp. ESL0791]|uniref:acyltransferase family protein n=1 Tax=Lactobacillus sp. ESL0791 TaxID=2983234 RepID=UPI0023F7E4A9|nr:acyltransferase [Lactobacillus sp. ESL0791]MDF7639057.1 acyltransferase [Lactobacillus sp. ESL0791]